MSSAPDSRHILALNCGSSSLKFGLYVAQGPSPELLCEGEAEEIGHDSGSFWLKTASGSKQNEQRSFENHAAALSYVLEAMRRRAFPDADVVGHRFVHGGPNVREHTQLTPAILEQLRAAVPYAPLHVPPALTVLDAICQKLPNAPQVICLDTAFHRHMPAVSKFFALPYELQEQGIERYGFHGLSLESILPQLDPLPSRLVVAHLGNGSSITAIQDGISVDTTMGLTPTGGIMMGTRCGDLDPGVLVYLLRHGYATAAELEKLVDKQSGLLGVSGLTNDVRELTQVSKTNSQAGLALQMFCYQVRKAVAAMAAALEGIDGLVFTGGIGEHAEHVRREVSRGIQLLGLDEARIQVRPAKEDQQICLITMKITPYRQ